MEEHISSLFSKHPWAELLIERSFKVLIIIAAVLVCAKLIHVVSTRILTVAHKAKLGDEHDGKEREKRLATLVKLVDTTLRVMLFSLAILMALRELGLDITPLLTGAGIAGVAVGFGAQSLVKDMISGFFILVEDQIRLGDVVKINNGLAGSVERMEFRVTAIRDGDGTLHIIPNGEIKSVSNMTYEFGQAVVDIPVPYSVEIRRLSGVLSKVAEDLELDPKLKPELRSRPQFAGVVDFKPNYMVAQIVAKTEPHSRWAVAREIRERAKAALDQAGIALPPLPT